jgi:hypothetical protein
MLAYCGLECDSCPIHLATLEPDKLRRKEMKISIAKQCVEIYGMIIKTEDITDCDGCNAVNPRLFSGCKNCEIRSCALSRKIMSCAFCNDYVCERLNNHFLNDPDARKRLEKIRLSGRS